MGETKAERSQEVPPLSSSPASARRASGPTRRSTKGGWTNEEDAILARAVKQFDGRNWKRIAEAFPGRTDIQCLHRWQKVLNPELVKGNWTKEEDECIIKLVAKHGCKRWSVIANSLPGRMGKQCRERWHNHLNPAIKKDAWTLEEEVTLIQAQQKYGNKWADIAKFLPGRAENSIKNHWNCSLKKKLTSYSASDSFDQKFGIIPLNLRDCLQRVGCSEADPSKQGMLELGSCFMASAIILDRQNPSIGAKGSNLQHLGGESRCFGVNNQNMTLEDSRFLDMEVNVSPTRRSKFMKEVNNSPKPLNFCLDKSPCASAQTPLSCNSHFSSELPCHESDTWRRDDAACENASDDLQNDFTIYSKVHPSLGNHFFSEDHSYIDKTKILGSDLAENDGGYDSNLVPMTEHLEIKKLGCLSCLPLQMKDVLVSTSSEESADLYGHSQRNHSPVESSTPPNLLLGLASTPTSPKSFLRSAAKSFKNTPSILRKRKRESSKQLFVDC